MTLVKAAHRRFLRIHHEGDFESYIRVLEGLATLLERDVLPHSPSIDTKKESIENTRKAIFEAGLCRMPFDSKYEGLDLPFSVYCLGVELAGAAEASAAMSVAIHTTVATGISEFGTDEQKSRWLADLITGRKLAAFGLTEQTSGSDAGALNTTAVREGGKFRIIGSKMYITNAGEADLYLIFARAAEGPSAFLI